jgi:hypothetical protein
MSRYKNSDIKRNVSELYKKLRKERGLPDALVQYETNRKKAPTVEEIKTLNNVGHIWTTGDRLYKLADKYYNDPELWWIIAWYNNKPTEAHFKAGDLIQIPLPLERVYGLLRM